MSTVAKKQGNVAVPTVVRTARAPNTIVALHTEDTDAAPGVVTLDLCIRRPSFGSPGEVGNGEGGLLVKNMARGAKEVVDKTLDRVRLLFSPPRGKGKSAKQQSKEEMLAACPPISVVETRNAEEDLGQFNAAISTMTNEEFWKQVKVLRVGTEAVTVKYNVPTITDIVPPSKPFVGMPLVCPSITTVFAAAEDLHYEWCLKISDAASGEEGIAVLSTQEAFEPSTELLGKRLILRVSPDVATGLWTQVELAPVEMPPPGVDRWNETTTRVAFPAFRTVTYNILYDDFCTSESSKAKIYPFATDEVLAIENRQVRILQELLAYNADLICLQECGKKVFSKYLLPALKTCGFDGFYANKSGSVQEGCGFLFRSERFSLESTEVFPLNWETLEKREPAMAAGIADHVELKEALTHITSIGAILTLKERISGKELVLGNTHLFFHANACHIRILQMYTLLSCLRAAAARGLPEGAEARPIVLCGDCNFTHATGGYRLVTTGQVEDTHPSWEKGKLFWWGCARQLGYNAEQLAEVMKADDFPEGSRATGTANGQSDRASQDTERGPKREAERPREPLSNFFHESLHAGLKLSDAYWRTNPSLPWTNFTMTFREVIDYIFFSEDSIDVLRTIPIPPESELAENYALPNAKYPSDHVALIADLTFKR